MPRLRMFSPRDSTGGTARATQIESAARSGGSLGLWTLRGDPQRHLLKRKSGASPSDEKNPTPRESKGKEKTERSSKRGVFTSKIHSHPNKRVGYPTLAKGFQFSLQKPSHPKKEEGRRSWTFTRACGQVGNNHDEKVGSQASPASSQSRVNMLTDILSITSITGISATANNLNASSLQMGQLAKKGSTPSKSSRKHDPAPRKTHGQHRQGNRNRARRTPAHPQVL